MKVICRTRDADEPQQYRAVANVITDIATADNRLPLSPDNKPIRRVKATRSLKLRVSVTAVPPAVPGDARCPFGEAGITSFHGFFAALVEADDCTDSLLVRQYLNVDGLNAEQRGEMPTIGNEYGRLVFDLATRSGDLSMYMGHSRLSGEGKGLCGPYARSSRCGEQHTLRAGSLALARGREH
jgi:hypothetical protein